MIVHLLGDLRRQHYICRAQPEGFLKLQLARSNSFLYRSRHLSRQYICLAALALALPPLYIYKTIHLMFQQMGICPRRLGALLPICFERQLLLLPFELPSKHLCLINSLQIHMQSSEIRIVRLQEMLQ